jgi:4-hydroxybenzoyl-CoA reductase subunit beta
MLGEPQRRAVVLAGGTALMILLGYRLGRPGVVVDLKGVSGLHSVARSERGGLSLGCMVTLDTLEHSPLVRKECALLAQAAGLVAVPPIRRKATLGGNLCLDTRCNYHNQSEFWRSGLKDCFKRGGDLCNAVEKGRRCQAVYQGDLGPVLMALAAEIRIVSAGGERLMPVAEFFTGRGEIPNTLKPGEILAELRIPPAGPGVAGAYEKLRVREGMDYPLAGAAVVVKVDPSGRIEQARVVLGGLGSSPVEVVKAAGLLAGRSLAEVEFQDLYRAVLEKAHPAGNLAMDAAYRRKMVPVLVERALRRAVASATG